MIGMGTEPMNSSHSVPASCHGLNLILPCCPEVEDDFGSLASVENPTELRARVAGDVLAADRYAEPDSTGGSRTPVEDLQNALAIYLNQELDTQEWLLRQQPLPTVQSNAGP